MSTQTVREVIRRFLVDPKPAVLVIRGKWGVGKTFFWQSCVHGARGEASRRRYSYVSLFGASSIQQLQLATVIGSMDIQHARDPSKPLTKLDTGTKELKRLVQPLANAMSGLLGRWDKVATIGIDALAPHLVNDLLICFDDFERLPELGVQFEEILGFVTTLREEKNCKAVLIFNDAQMDERRVGIYRRYREKVVDVELLFEPTAKEAADLAIPADHSYAGVIRGRLEVLNVTNIRMIRRILANVGLVQPLLAPLERIDRATAEANVAMTVLLTCLEYDRNEDRPPLEFLEKWQSAPYLMSEAMGEERERAGAPVDPERARRKKWSELLQSYGVFSFDACDAALARVVKSGFAEGSGLKEEVDRLMPQVEALRAEEQFTRAWRLYHDSLEDNGEEIAQIVDQTFDAAAPRITPGNVDATIRLMRDIGKEGLADSLIERYTRIRGNEPKLFDPDEWHGAGDIKDERFAQIAKQLHEQRHAAPTLHEVMLVLSKNRGWSQEQIQVLNDATAAELYTVFKSGAANFKSMAGACLRFAADPTHGHVAERATEALKRIASESRLNRRRIEAMFGIRVD